MAQEENDPNDPGGVETPPNDHGNKHALERERERGRGGNFLFPVSIPAM